MQVPSTPPTSQVVGGDPLLLDDELLEGAPLVLLLDDELLLEDELLLLEDGLPVGVQHSMLEAPGQWPAVDT